MKMRDSLWLRSMWGTFFCIFWRRRCGWLAHIWGNGWIEARGGDVGGGRRQEGEDLRGPGSVGSAPTRVRPEFALQWRQGFEQAHPRRQAETLRPETACEHESPTVLGSRAGCLALLGQRWCLGLRSERFWALEDVEEAATGARKPAL